MNTCTYKIMNGDKVEQTFSSYEDLYADVRSKEDKLSLDKVSDIVYSESTKRDVQEQQLQKIKQNDQVKEDYKDIQYDAGEPDIEGKITTLHLLDSDLANINGNPIVTRFDEKGYIEALRQKLLNGVKDENNKIIKYTAEEAEAEIQNVLSHWQDISEDGGAIHRIFDSTSFRMSPEEFIKAQKSNNLSSRLQNPDVLERLHQSIKTIWLREYGKYADPKLVTNVIMKAPIKGTDTEVYGKANWVFIGSDGTLHLYLVKVSTMPPADWVQVKTQKYVMQLALLKRMLAANGLNVDNIDMNIIPVQLKYNNDYSAVTDAIVRKPITYSSKYKGVEYNMSRQDAIAGRLIEGDAKPLQASSELLQSSLDTARLIFPEVNIVRTGIERSAREWIRQAPTENYSGVEPLVIKKVHERDYRYKVEIDGKEYKVKNDKDLLELVQANVSKLTTNKAYAIQRIKDAILKSYEKGKPQFLSYRGLEHAAPSLKALFSKYIRGTADKDGNIYHEWELVDIAEEAGIFVFKNKDNVLDFVSLSSFFLNQKMIFKKGDNILGSYRTNSQFPGLTATYGNIEAVRAMTVINELAAKYKDYTFGNLYVMSVLGDMNYQMYNIGQFNNDWFRKILEETEKENKDKGITNNFESIQFLSPVQSVIQEYLRITSGLDDTSRSIYDDAGFDQLEAASSRSEQAAALLTILNYIDSKNGYFDTVKLENALQESETSEEYLLAKLFKMSAIAYNYISGNHITLSNKYSEIGNEYMTTPTVPNANLRIIAENMQIANDKIAEEFIGEYGRTIRGQFDEFYKAVGYTHLENMVVGDQVRTFKNMFVYDPETGDNTFVFKNPYDDSTDLNSAERKLLKHILYTLTYINYNGNLDMAEYDDAAIKAYIEKHPEYLWVPLEKASSATNAFNPKAWKARLDYSFNKLKHYFANYDYFLQDMTDEEREAYGGKRPEEKDFYELHLRDPFSMSMPTSGDSNNEKARIRKRMIEDYGASFFETNLENLLIDVLASRITTTQYNKFLVSSKALMFELGIARKFGANAKVIDKEIEWMQKYLKLNVFRVPIMSESKKKVAGVISPIKSVVTRILIGGNIISAVRDVIQGTQQNFIRTVIKLGTDITPAELERAYAYVHTHSTSDPMAYNLLSALCFRFRLSNMDVARIKERAKTDRTGAANAGNVLMSTLHSPDFLNRMTLFVARCIHDGVMDISVTGDLRDSAFSLSQTGQLLYDWKKDKRFKAYAENSSDQKAYKEAKARYLSYIYMYNQENTDSPIKVEDNLPSPYTNVQMNSVRGFADNIYGAYDKSKQGMAMFELQGVMFGTFSNWMNGIINTYFMSAQKNNTTLLQQEQVRDDRGRLLFLNDDGSTTTEDTGLPLVTWIPAAAIGILPMVMEAALIAKDGGIKAGLRYLRSDSMRKARTDKLITDFIMFGLYAALFGWILTPSYKKYKKEMKSNPLLVNLVTEVLYKSWSRSYDDFLGPVNVIQFFGEDMNPPYYSQPISMIKDVGRVVTGKKNWYDALLNSSGFTRTGQDAFKAYFRSKA